MSKENKMHFYYMLSMVMLIIFPATFLVMPVNDMIQFQNPRIVLVMVGVTFWVSGITGYTFLVLAYKLKKQGQSKRKLYLFANVPTAIADGIFILGVLVFIVLVWRDMTGEYIAYIDIFLTLSAFNMHLLCSRGLYKGMKRSGTICREI